MVFAPPGSTCRVCVRLESPIDLPNQIGQRGVEAPRLSAIVDELETYDVVLDHTSPEGLARVASAPLPVVHIALGPRLSARAHSSTVASPGATVINTE